MADSPESQERDVAYWDNQLEGYHREFRNWEQMVKKICRRYALTYRKANSRESRSPEEFNILWSNIQVMHPEIYSRDALPEIRRRHTDKDPVGRVAAELLQRAESTELDTEDIESVFKAVALDLLLAGRGVPWVDYKPNIGSVPATDDDGQPITNGDGEMEMEEHFLGERAPIMYVYSEDFAHAVRRSWADVQRDGWVGRRVFMTQEQGLDKFGPVFRDVPLNAVRGSYHDPDASRGKGTTDHEDEEGAFVWEIHDVGTRKVYWLNREYADKLLKVSDDYLNLQGFFPCPKPAYGSLTNRSLVPTPDYEQYRSLAAQLDRLVMRESILTEAVKVRGIYDKSMQGLSQMLDDKTEGNRLFGIDNMADFLAKGATGTQLNAVVQYLPLNVIVAALQTVQELIRDQKEMIYEVIGIADIMRGTVDPREKLGQSQLKQQQGSKRLSTRRREMERVVRDTYAIKAEIMCEHYAPETLRELSGYDQMSEVKRLDKIAKANPQAGDLVETMFANVIELIGQDKMRTFRLDIETDATIMADEQLEAEKRDAFIDSTGSMIANAVPLAVEMPELKPVVAELLKFSVRGQRAGRSIESAIDEFAERMAISANQAQSQQEEGGQPAEPPDPEKQAKAQNVQQQGAVQIQTDMSKLREQHTKEQAAKLKLEQDMQAAALKMEKMASEIREKDAKIAEMQEKTRQTRRKGAMDQLRGMFSLGSNQGDQQ